MWIGWGIEFFVTLIEGYVGLGLIDQLCQKTRRKLVYRILWAALTAVVALFLNYFKLFSYFTIFTCVFFHFLYAYSYYSENIIDCFVVSTLTMALILTVDSICAVSWGLALGDQQYVDQILAIGANARTVFIITDKLLLILVGMAAKKMIRSLKQPIRIPRTALVFSMGVFLLTGLTSQITNISVMLNWILYLGMIMTVCFLLWYASQLKKQQELNQLLKVKEESYEKGYAQLRAQFDEKFETVHDIKNHLLGISQLIKDQKYGECLNYIESLQVPLNDIVGGVWTGNSTIDFVLGCKKSEAQKKSIPFIIDADAVGAAGLTAKDIYAIFGNLIDNAIEAARQCPEGTRHIKIGIYKINEMLLIQVKNSLCRMPSVKKGRLVSEKEDKTFHGLGVKSVEACVSRLGGTYEYSYTDSEFTSEVMIYSSDPRNA